MPTRKLRVTLDDGISRGEFYARVNNLMDEVDPLVDEAYEFVQALERNEVEKGHDAELPWHISFHGSQFPGDDPLACGRAQIYRMMDLPRSSFPRRAVQFMDQGKDFERQLVRRWWRAGLLLSNPPFKGIPQTMFKDDENMLTSTTDAILVGRRSVQPIVCEVKQIYADHVEEFIRLVREIHPQYRRQTKCEVGMAHEAGPQVRWRCFNTGRLAIQFPTKWHPDTGDVIELGPWVCPEHMHQDCLHEVELEPVNRGYLYYASRDNAIRTRSFMFEYDSLFMAAGRRKLASWRDNFQAGTLPQTNFEGTGNRSHPFGWTWTRSQKMPDSPCEWCDFGQTCRDDHRKAVAQGNQIQLADSSGVELAERIKPEYDYEAIRSATLKFWGLDDRRDRAMIPPSTDSRKEAA
jgi:hypothetical protein